MSSSHSHHDDLTMFLVGRLLSVYEEDWKIEFELLILQESPAYSEILKALAGKDVQVILTSASSKPGVERLPENGVRAYGASSSPGHSNTVLSLG